MWNTQYNQDMRGRFRRKNTKTKCLPKAKQFEKMKVWMSDRHINLDLRGWFRTKVIGTKCPPKVTRNQIEKNRIFKRQNNQDLRGWSQTEDKRKNNCPIDRIIRTLGDGSEQRTQEPSISPTQSGIRKWKNKLPIDSLSGHIGKCNCKVFFVPF